MRTLPILAALSLTLACSSESGDPPASSTASAESTSMSSGVASPHRHAAQRVVRTDLVSDEPGAAMQDTSLVNAWGLAFNPRGFAWVSDNGTGMTTVYDATGARKLAVTIPAPKAGDTSAPSGQVFNDDTSNFEGDVFLFATEDGTIAGWSSGAMATLRVDDSASGAVYKGIALAKHCDGPRLYAADFHNGAVDVYDATYAEVETSGGFVDPRLPKGYAPFNVVAFGDDALLVSYALQDADAHDDVKGPGHGFVDLFDLDGRLIQRLVTRGALNSPWGMAFARSFGHLHDRLLVGNFGDGRVNVYEVERAWWGFHVEHEGALEDASGAPLVIDGLWAIAFPPEANGFHAGELVFTAGPDDESHGRFGVLAPR